MVSQRDIFLSHRSLDKDFVRKLASDIESESHNNQSLLTWVDEAEIKPGQSITGMVNAGLQDSRYIGLILTPNYFEGSGWTDAEWHSVLFNDPDNRKGRLIPILVEECPNMPVLLTHLRRVDCRGDKYENGLKEILAILKDLPLPRFSK